MNQIMKDDTLLLLGNTILGFYQELEEIPRKEELTFHTIDTSIGSEVNMSISFSELEFTINRRKELIILGGIYNHYLIDEFLHLVKYQSQCTYQLRNIYLLAIGYPSIIREEEVDPLILICERDRIEFYCPELPHRRVSENQSNSIYEST